MYTEVEDKALFQNGTLCFESSSRRRKLYLFKYVQPLKASSYHRAGLSGPGSPKLIAAVLLVLRITK